MRVRVLSRAAVEAGAAEGVDAIISIRSTALEPCEDLDLAVQQAVLGDMQGVLVQRFDDIGIPAYGPYRGPTMEDLAIALDFARAVRDRVPEGVLAVHCQHGVSRSAAVALAIIADEAGPGAEANAVAALLRQDDDARMQPNPLIVSLADAALFRYGHLDAALAAVCPRYVAWRDNWRDIALDPGAYWEQARRVRLRPRRREV